MENPRPSRQEIRRIFRRKRQRLTSKQQHAAASDILTTCLASTSLKQAKTVACYLANDGEVDPIQIIQFCWDQGKRLVVPVLHPFCQGHLVFVEYSPNSPTRRNGYGIVEPIVTSANICILNKIDLIFTPLVAFDALGNRLGMGGGYYDRTLAPIVRDALQVQIVGLAHHCQLAEKLPTNNWDVCLDGIATPEHFFAVS